MALPVCRLRRRVEAREQALNRAENGEGRKRIRIQIIGALSMCLLLCVVLVSSTYAWFTVNRRVSTGKVTAQTGQEELQLLLSGSENGPFSATEASIVQVNATNKNFLMPVSTANLSTFSVRLSNDGDKTARYGLVEEERNFFHGRIYIKPTAVNMPTSGKLALYFDQGAEAGGALVQDVGGILTTAGRLGLKFQTPQAETYIFRLAPEETQTGQVVVNYSPETGFLEVQDPSRDLSAFEIKRTGDEVVLPAKPLAVLELNQTYILDIYFYLEGCDPDCTEKISMHQIDLHMAFYGVLTE